MKTIIERIIFKRVDKISAVLDLSLFEDKEITIEYLNHLITTKKIDLKDFFYEKDVQGVIHSLQNSVEFKKLMIEMIEAVKDYRDTDYLVPINKVKITNNRFVGTKKNSKEL